jgi:HAD superfamily hydrolase (TIGR01484 family)
MKPNQAADTFSDYTRAMLLEKGYTEYDAILFEESRRALRMAFERIYRAVAFDVDGTLTSQTVPPKNADPIPIDDRMGSVIADLLVRGVPVFLITGRGGSVKKAALRIKHVGGLSTWQLRRLYCIPYNGVVLWRTLPEDGNQFLGGEEVLFPWMGMRSFHKELTRTLAESLKEEYPSIRVDMQSHSFRIVAEEKEIRDEIHRMADDLTKRIDEQGVQVHVSKGRYGNKDWTVDISAANKGMAIKRIAQIFDIPLEKILCIGDQGAPHGNDFALLDSGSAFSVDTISEAHTKCFPVIDERGSMLKGVDAARELLRRVRIFPDLCTKPSDPTAYLKDLRRFECRALLRARRETASILEHLRLRLKYLLEEDAAIPPVNMIELDDIFDKSGGVILRDWEIGRLINESAFQNLFDVKEITDNIIDPGPKSKTCMYTRRYRKRLTIALPVNFTDH